MKAATAAAELERARIRAEEERALKKRAAKEARRVQQKRLLVKQAHARAESELRLAAAEAKAALECKLRYEMQLAATMAAREKKRQVLEAQKLKNKSVPWYSRTKEMARTPSNACGHTHNRTGMDAPRRRAAIPDPRAL